MAKPTFNLCSFLLTMTEVICWSMKRRTVRRRAGMLARRYMYLGKEVREDGVNGAAQIR